MPPLIFETFSSSIEPAFWQALTELKIDSLKLDEAAVPFTASYTRGRVVFDRETGEDVSLGCLASLSGSSFAASPTLETRADDAVELRGQLINFNTIEAFRAADKSVLFQTVIDVLWSRIQSGKSLTVADLNPILLLTFADLKKYKYYYWFAFPALIADTPWEIEGSSRSLYEVFGPKEHMYIHSVYNSWAKRELSEAAACLLRRFEDETDFSDLPSFKEFFADTDPREVNIIKERFRFALNNLQRFLLFLDPSAHPDATGWPLRNVLAYLREREGLDRINLILWRDDFRQDWNPQTSKSKVFTIYLPPSSSTTTTAAKPKATGWEKNAVGKLGPRLADLGPMMDPRQLADSAVDLNLKLMKWRILPTLDLDRVKETKCLLLGAGTLGCYVARTLLAWGVRHITLVDSAKVSFSNPVRQPLFEFADCLEGGKPKAECAATALTRIYPGVVAKGVLLNIPMPGHPVPPTQIDMARADVETLDALIDAHDVVYLLMDSRESRWLPTLLAATKSKLVINAALGFDSYLVLRHGIASSDRQVGEVMQPGQPYRGKLGCYFCNDIVAPTDSLSDRTLDQMCTVTRPGLASLASASAVELMVSLLQHVDGAKAHADTESVLGSVPHQLRGFLARFETMKIVGQAYDRCTGCSDRVIEAYRRDGFSMLLRAFDDAKSLERATGLDQLQQETGDLENLDWDEAEEIS